MGVSGQQGMGAIPFQGGAGFRVWAPFASIRTLYRDLLSGEARPGTAGRQAAGV
jgi:hypothetical protein